MAEAEVISYTATDKKHQGLSASTRSKERGMKSSLPQSFQRIQPAEVSISDFWAPRTEDNTLLLIEATRDLLLP